MENNKPTQTGSTLRKSGLIIAVLLSALSLSACVVAAQDDYRGGRHRHHWNNDGYWNDGGWQGGGSWNHHHH
jgi:hypothetical protein